MKDNSKSKQGYVGTLGSGGHKGLLSRKQVVELQNIIGIKFRNPSLLEEAFTHRSYLNESRNIAGRERLRHNELLEFLGDAVLELATTDKLCRLFPGHTEGVLTEYRATLVNTSKLAEVARELGLEKFLLMSKGQASDTDRALHYILANTFEAVVGAIYMDRGLGIAMLFLEEYLFKSIDELYLQQRFYRDAKSYFQEAAQGMAGITPHYQILEESGLDHQKFFIAGCFLGDRMVAKGGGFSKREAEFSAAKTALKQEYGINVNNQKMGKA